MITAKFFLKVFIITNLVSCTIERTKNCIEDDILSFVRDGNIENLESCHNSGVDIFINDKKGISVYNMAMALGKTEMAQSLQKLLLNKWEADGKLINHENFYRAIEFDYPNMMKQFINGGLDFTVKDEDGVVPVVYAVFNNSNRALELLLNNKIDVNYQFDFRPLICIAAMFNQQESVEILLKYGASINDEDGAKVTPLMFAARDGYVNLAKYLLKNGANRMAQDNVGNTALDMARMADNIDMINLLAE